MTLSKLHRCFLLLTTLVVGSCFNPGAEAPDPPSSGGDAGLDLFQFWEIRTIQGDRLASGCQDVAPCGIEISVPDETDITINVEARVATFNPHAGVPGINLTMLTPADCDLLYSDKYTDPYYVDVLNPPYETQMDAVASLTSLTMIPSSKDDGLFYGYSLALRVHHTGLVWFGSDFADGTAPLPVVLGPEASVCILPGKLGLPDMYESQYEAGFCRGAMCPQ